MVEPAGGSVGGTDKPRDKITSRRGFLGRLGSVSGIVTSLFLMGGAVQGCWDDWNDWWDYSDWTDWINVYSDWINS